MRANQKVHLIRKACIVLFREGKISFYDDENPHSLFFISIAPRLNWKRYLRTEDPGNLSMRKKLWTLSIENTSPTDIKRSFQWWSKDLYARKDILFCCPHLLLKNHDFHFGFQCPRKYELQLLWKRKQTIMEFINECYKYKHPYRCHFFEDFYMRERHFSFPLWQPLRQSGCIPAPEVEMDALEILPGRKSSENCTDCLLPSAPVVSGSDPGFRVARLSSVVKSWKLCWSIR